MAGDWIKMRVSLPTDPKVIKMADALAADGRFMRWLTFPVMQSCKNSAYEHVTPSVTVSVTVCALLRVWGMVAEVGKRDAQRDGACDIVVSHADLETLDQVAQVEGFGDAMAAVGWVEQRATDLVFSNYLADNSSVQERSRTAAAERKRRQRERDKGRDEAGDMGVTKSVTVTPREEKKRVENIYNPPPSPPTPQTPTAAAAAETTDGGGREGGVEGTGGTAGAVGGGDGKSGDVRSPGDGLAGVVVDLWPGELPSGGVARVEALATAFRAVGATPATLRVAKAKADKLWTRPGGADAVLKRWGDLADKKTETPRVAKTGLDDDEERRQRVLAADRKAKEDFARRNGTELAAAGTVNANDLLTQRTKKAAAPPAQVAA